MDDTNVRWLGIAGSLRKGSFNRALLAAASALLPDGATLDGHDLAGVPLYDGDLDQDDHRPPSVRELKAKIADADGLLIVSPEYNYGIPGVLKNAIDWASRPGYKSVLATKPVAVMGASMSVTGSARGQQELRGAMLACLCLVYPAPDVALGEVQNKIKNGTLEDAEAKEQIRRFLSGFAGFTRMATRARADGVWPTAR